MALDVALYSLTMTVFASVGMSAVKVERLSHLHEPSRLDGSQGQVSHPKRATFVFYELACIVSAGA